MDSNTQNSTQNSIEKIRLNNCEPERIFKTFVDLLDSNEAIQLP